MTVLGKPYENQPTREPDLSGMGRAWRIDAPEDAPPHAGVGQWLVHAPHSHPWWPWYAVQAVHLRPLDGQEAHIQFPGATHEWLVVALDPREPLPNVDPSEGIQAIHHLEPIDQCVQFIVANDEQAGELVELSVRHILEGVGCDQDFREYWQQAIANTAEHIRLGGHPDREAS